MLLCSYEFLPPFQGKRVLNHLRRAKLSRRQLLKTLLDSNGVGAGISLSGEGKRGILKKVSALPPICQKLRRGEKRSFHACMLVASIRAKELRRRPLRP